MTTVKRGLGRGLSALIPDEEMELFRRVARNETVDLARPPSARLEAATKKKNEQRTAKIYSSKQANPTSATIVERTAAVASISESEVSRVALQDIEANPYQPRRTFDEAELTDLANSIREHGVIQPVVVRPSPSGDKPYQLIVGERRWRASQRAGLEFVPAIVRPVDDLHALELALIENVQRHDISAIDSALAYRRLADEFQLSQESIAQRVGKSRSAVANTMRLLDLQPEIRKAIEERQISEGHGRAILLARGEGARRALFRKLMRDGLSVREIERLAKENDGGTDSPSSFQSAGEVNSIENKRLSKELQQLVEQLQKELGARLVIQRKRRGGKIVIEYSDDEELQRLTDLLSNRAN